MTNVLVLAKLEYLRHRAWSLGPDSDQRIVGGIILTLILGGMWITFASGSSTALLLSSLAVYVFAVSGLSVTGFMAAGRPAEREWWVTFPHRRTTLVLGKALAYLRLSGRVALLVSFSAIIVYVLSWSLIGERLFPSSSLFQLAVLVCLIAVIATPIAVTFGILSLVFLTGLARLGLFGLFLIPAVSMGFLTGLLEHSSRAALGTFLLHTSAWLLAIGWPVAVLSVWVSRIGVNRLGNTKLRQKGSVVASSPTHSQSYLAVPQHPSLALWRLELSRFRWLTTRAVPIERISAWSVTFLLVVAGFFAAYSRETVAYVPAEWIVIGSLIIVILSYTIPQRDFQSGFGYWWLGIPMDRKRLLTIRVAAVIAMGFFYVSFGLGALWLGIWMHALFLALPPGTLPYSLSFLGRAVAILLILTPLEVLAFQGLPALQTGFKSVLSIPMYVLGMNLNNYLFNNVLPFISHSSSGPVGGTTFWTHFAIIFLVCLPLAAWGIRAGAQNLHHYANRNFNRNNKF